MSFDAFEFSAWLGKAIRLYRFDRQHLSWLFTDADRDITIGADTYLSVRGAIKSGAIRDTSNAKRAEFKITLPYLLDPADPEPPVTQSLGDNWRPYPPGDTIEVTVMETHFGDPDQEVRIRWTGVVIGPEFTDTEIVLNCGPNTSGTSKGGGLALRWCRACPLVVFSQGHGLCNANRAAHELPATLTDVTGLVLTAAAFGTLPAGRLRGGFVTWVRANGLTERRDIMAHVGSTITVNFSSDELEEDLEVTAIPGCKHNWDDCGYFENQDNYGGARFMPTKNLFDGNRHIQ